jgi:hypothetical protein
MPGFVPSLMLCLLTPLAAIALGVAAQPFLDWMRPQLWLTTIGGVSVTGYVSLLVSTPLAFSAGYWLRKRHSRAWQLWVALTAPMIFFCLMALSVLLVRGMLSWHWLPILDLLTGAAPAAAVALGWGARARWMRQGSAAQIGR